MSKSTLPRPILKRNHFAIYEIKGASNCTGREPNTWYVMVNKHNEMLMNIKFLTPMAYMGTSIKDVLEFYYKHNVTFCSEFDFDNWKPVSWRVYKNLRKAVDL